MNTLIWFQRDLRVQSNAALSWAIAQDKPIVAVYIHSPEENAPWAEGAASRWWLHNSLKNLEADLLKLNIKLHFFHASSVAKIHELVNSTNISSVVWTARGEPERVKCESSIKAILREQRIEVKCFKDDLLASPDHFLTVTNNTPYKVFTPFYKKLRAELKFEKLSHAKNSGMTNNTFQNDNLIDSQNLEQLKLLDSNSWHTKLHQFWTPGEASALEKLDRFVENCLEAYKVNRDIPSIDGTSNLSPHLHFGEITPQQIVSALAPLIELRGGNIANAAEVFLRQIIWREYARYILWHYPETSILPMNGKYKKSFWKRSDINREKKWQQGKTGLAIVDAGMKQLWETGWMHNRVRMLVASLLTKNLGVAWQNGASWFWDTLVDADLANNSMGWQWVAGCGVDAAPYFRVFNPNTQENKFDKNKIYVNRWLGEISEKSSPKPIVDLALSRALALDRYKRYIQTSNTN